MADVTASFGIDLESNAEGVAQASASALEELRQRIQGGIEELRGMNAALRNLKGGGNAAASAIKDLQQRIAAQKAIISNAQQAYIRLGGSFKPLRHESKDTALTLQQLLLVARGMPGPIGTLTARFAALSKLLGGGVMAVGVISVVAAIAALTVATTAAVGMLVRYGIAQADARRSELLRLEGLTKIRYFMFGFGAGFGRAADKADFLQGVIDQVSGSVAIGRDEIGRYTEQLYKMGLRGGNLQAALEGVAMTAAVQGDAQAQAFAQWAAGANLTGQSVRRLADDVKARLGGIAARQMLSLGVQSQKLRENFDALFRNIKIERLLEGFGKITELLSQSSASGRALKVVVDSLLQPLIDNIAGTTPLAKRFFQGLVIGALLVTIAILRVRNAWRHAFGNETAKSIFTLNNAVLAGVFVVGTLVSALVLSALTITTVFGLVKAVVLSVIEPFRQMFSAINAAAKDGDWVGIAAAIIDGLVFGIERGVGRFAKALADMARTGWKAFTAVWQIRSPSRLAFGGAVNIGRGLELGAEAQRPRVQRAIARMASPEALTAAPAPAVAGVRGGGGRAASGPLVSVGELHVHTAATESKGIVADIRSALERQLEGLAVQLGAVTA